jgi:hypothetical protein
MNLTYKEALEIFKHLVASAWGEGDREIAWCRHDPALARNLEMLQGDFEELYGVVEVPPLFIQVLHELDLYLEITKNLLTDSQLDHVSTVGSQLTTTGDIPSAITLRDRWEISARIREKAIRLLKERLT